MTTSDSEVVVDTDVFSSLYVRRRQTASTDWEAWRRLLTGRSVIISFMTRAEVLDGAQSARWGEVRMGRLRGLLNNTPTIWVDAAVTDVAAWLAAECRQTGHPLHQKAHTADRWIAATAIAHQLPLVSRDAIFQHVPRLHQQSPPGDGSRV